MTLMQSKSTSKTRFRENFLLSLKSNKKILTVMSILHLLGLPLLAGLIIMSISNSGDYSNSSYDIENAFLLIGVFCFCAAISCGIILAINNFDYLYKKSKVDMIHSLPIKKTHKFLSDYLAGLLGYIVPYIIACILGDIILMGGYAFVDDMKDLIHEAGAFIIQCEFAGLLVIAMFYTLAVLVLCCCGSFFESVINIVLINGMIPGIIAVVASMFFVNLYGVPVLNTAIPVIGYTSPVGAVIYCFTYIDSGMYYNSNTNCIDAVSYAKWVVCFIAFIAVYFLISLFLYKKRKAEDVSKPYVFKLLYYILITTITMAISLIARFENSVIVPVVLFAFIIYMIFEIITNRGFKKFYKSIARYAVTMVAIFVVCIVADKTNGFGVQDRVYSSSKIKSVELNYTGMEDILEGRYNYYYYYDEFLDRYKTIGAYTDKGIIETITNVQRQALETYRSGKFDTYNGYYTQLFEDDYVRGMDCPSYDITFKFNLKSGKTVTRNYVLSFEQLRQLFILESTEQVAQYKADKLMESITNYEIIENTNKYDISYELAYSIYPGEFSHTKISLTKDEAKELAECYKLDYMDSSTDELMNSQPVCYVGQGYSEKQPIRENFSRTIDFITMHGGSYTSSYVSNGRLYSPKGYKCWGSDDITSTFGEISAKRGFSHEISCQQTKELMKYAYYYYYASEDCYILEFDGRYYAIPQKYSDIAEKIYNSYKTVKHTYTGEMFMKDLRECKSADEYLNKYCWINGDINFELYDDIQTAFGMRNFTDNTTIEEVIEMYGMYEYEGDYAEDLLSQHKLLIKFFNFVSVDEYIEYMKQQGQTVDENTVYNEWEQYSELFPILSENVIEK